jgi:hypothetical protein
MGSEMSYLGIRFTEVSLVVRVLLQREGGGEGMRLLHAFTTSRVFAWCERVFFRMPHEWAECQVSVKSPIAIRVRTGGGWVLRAEMSSLPRESSRAGNEAWKGPIFLPRRSGVRRGGVLFAYIRGHTLAYPFGGTDRFTLDGLAGAGMLRSLLNSEFSANEWGGLMLPTEEQDP